MRIITNFELEDIDLDQLYSCKRELIQLIWNDSNSILWSAVDLINRVQQQAIEHGLWKLPPNLQGAIVRKSDKLATEPVDGELCWDLVRAVGMERRNGEWVDVSYSYWVEHHEKENLNDKESQS